MSKISLICTESQHQYIYSDKLHYFLYVPKKMKAVIEEEAAILTDKNSYYLRKFHFLQECSFFDKEAIRFQTNYTEKLLNRIWHVCVNC